MWPYAMKSQVKADMTDGNVVSLSYISKLNVLQCICLLQQFYRSLEIVLFSFKRSFCKKCVFV